ncbi:PQQ-dependent sugar dehydrogenase [Streptomyces sp. NPDC017936]|uniref:PQQ-dependent sugar dehydrogenase n=1 Tax=Streptomyces sp. NPDC017936 TaxID=3365016 RepID=UPI0037AB8C65
MSIVRTGRTAVARAVIAVAAAAGLLAVPAATGHATPWPGGPDGPGRAVPWPDGFGPAPWSAEPAPSEPRASAPSGVKTVSSGWNIPWGVNWLPDGTALINERDSLKLYRVTRSGARSEVKAEPHIAAFGSGASLLGIAVSPNWSRDHHIFVYHGAKNDCRIARLTFDGSRISDYTPLVTGIKRGLHNGGRIKFGPDGYLYATTGDADEPRIAQDKKSLNGKILRMTKAGKPAPGNPFGTLVYSYGHRNPEGLTWDDRGRLWETEIGEATHDELNLVKPGRNYGWPTCEGPCSTAGMTAPAHHWHPSRGVPSGLVYTDGALYVAALRGQRLWRIPVHATGIGTPVAYYADTYGRLRDVVKVPGERALWVTTDKAGKNADKVLEVKLR